MFKANKADQTMATMFKSKSDLNIVAMLRDDPAPGAYVTYWRKEDIGTSAKAISFRQLGR
jgi:hypothetical protein